MKKFLFFLVALTIILPVKAQVDIDDLEDSKFRIIIPRHDWTEYMGYEKNSDGELNVKVPEGSLMEIFPNFDKSTFLQSAIVGDKIFTLMSSGYEHNYPGKTSQGYWIFL